MPEVEFFLLQKLMIDLVDKTYIQMKKLSLRRFTNLPNFTEVISDGAWIQCSNPVISLLCCITSPYNNYSWGPYCVLGNFRLHRLVSYLIPL